mgnify:CR=1 FL=1
MIEAKKYTEVRYKKAGIVIRVEDKPRNNTTKVKLLGFDDRGKVRLSMKVVDQETGEEIKEEKKED